MYKLCFLTFLIFVFVFCVLQLYKYRAKVGIRVHTMFPLFSKKILIIFFNATIYSGYNFYYIYFSIRHRIY